MGFCRVFCCCRLLLGVERERERKEYVCVCTSDAGILGETKQKDTVERERQREKKLRGMRFFLVTFLVGIGSLKKGRKRKPDDAKKI